GPRALAGAVAAEARQGRTPDCSCTSLPDIGNPSTHAVASPRPCPPHRARMGERAGRRGAANAREAAVARGHGASSTWMCCGRALEPWMAEPRDAPCPRAAAAPSRVGQATPLPLLLPLLLPLPVPVPVQVQVPVPVPVPVPFQLSLRPHPPA